MYEVAIRRRVLPLTEPQESREWMISCYRNMKKNAVHWARMCEKQGYEARVTKLYPDGSRNSIAYRLEGE